MKTKVYIQLFVVNDIKLYATDNVKMRIIEDLIFFVKNIFKLLFVGSR